MSPNRAEVLVLGGPRSLEPRSIPIPETGRDDGILRVEAGGLCGTDHEQYTGHITAPFGFVPGHEVIGIVERAGDQAQKRWGVKEGDRVAVEVFLSCRECQMCLTGEYRRCINNGLRHMYGFIDVESEPGLWGGYATHLYLAPDAMLLPVPDGLDPVIATVFNPLGAGIRWGAVVPGTKNGDVVAVLGPGIRGLCTAAAAKEAGAEFVMITGVGPRDVPRLDLASQFGVDLAVDITTQDPARALKEATGGLADVVVDVTANAPAAPGQAIRLARPAGTVVLAGTRGSIDAIGFNPDIVVFKELRILGALGVDAPAYMEALSLLASGKYPFGSLPRRVAGLGDVEALVETMAGEGSDEIPVHGVFAPETR